MNIPIRVASIGLALALAGAGCRAPDSAYGLPTESERRAFGKIALVEVSAGVAYAARVKGDASFDPVVSGFVGGTLWSFDYGHRNADMLGAVVLLPVAIIVGSIIVGANNPTPAEIREVRRIRSALETGYRAANAPDKLTRRFLTAARLDGGVDIYWEPDPPVQKDSRVDHRAFAERQIDTVVELELQAVRASARADERPFRFRVDARVTAVRTSDGRVLRQLRRTYNDPTRDRTTRSWADRGGSAVTEEMDRATSLLATALAEDLFAHYRLANDEDPR